MERTILAKFEADFNQKKAEANQKFLDQKRKMEEEIRQREEMLRREREAMEAAKAAQDAELKRRVEEECKTRETEIQQKLTQKLQGDYSAQIQALKEAEAEKDERLKAARQKEVEFMRKEREMEELKANLEVAAEKRVLEERQRLQEQVRKEADEKSRLRDEEHQMKVKELEKQLADQKRLAEEALRKAEQGSMQLQGEVQELRLEELLRASFPFDMIKEVPKGVNGADCILTVRNNLMQECGCIVFESKRTKAFAAEWVDKLKSDMVTCCADIAVIVTAALPKDMDRFGERQGVYICSFLEVKSLIGVLRQAIIRVHEAKRSQENKGDKMVALYDYLTGSEFISQWNAMRENFQSFRNTLQKERDDFERSWKKKQRLLDTIITNSMQISGSIEGISGMESMNWATLPEGSGGYLE
jgi:hypothetical protein